MVEEVRAAALGMSASGGGGAAGGLQLRKCTVSGCARLCVKQSDSCRQHTDHPPLSKRQRYRIAVQRSFAASAFASQLQSLIPALLSLCLRPSVFEAPADEMFDPPSSSPPSFSYSSTPPLHTSPRPPATPPLLSATSSPFSNIVGRDTLTADRVINTADLIPYEIPIDHEDGGPPPTTSFLYDELDSGREREESRQRRGAAEEDCGLPLLPHSPTFPSSHSQSSTSPSPASQHHILVVDTKVDREEKDHFRVSPMSRSASASFAASSSSASSLYMSPRRPSLSPRSPHSPYIPPSTPRSVQALVDRIERLEAGREAITREAAELRTQLEAGRGREERLKRELKEAKERLGAMEENNRDRERERERGAGGAAGAAGLKGSRTAPLDLPPVTIISPSSASSSSSSSSHFSARLAAINASSSASSAPASSSLSSRGPQLAPLFTRQLPAGSASGSAPASSSSGTSPRHHHTFSAHALPLHPLPSSSSDLQSSASSNALSSYQSHTHSPSPSSSPLSSRPASASVPDSITPSLSPVSSFFTQPVTPTSSRQHTTRAAGGAAAAGRVKPSSNGVNGEGGSMNVGNVLGDRPSIRLFPQHAGAAGGEAMKLLLTDEGMGIRYDPPNDPKDRDRDRQTAAAEPRRAAAS